MDSFIKNYILILDKTSLSNFEKNIVKLRYLELVNNTYIKSVKFKILYLFLMNIITISGILIFILLSYEKMTQPETPPTIITWIMWLLSIILTLCNKWMYVFDIPKNHNVVEQSVKKLHIEGWNFVTSVGKYGAKHNKKKRFKIFLEQINKIEMKSDKLLKTDDSEYERITSGPDVDSEKNDNFDEITISE